MNSPPEVRTAGDPDEPSIVFADLSPSVPAEKLRVTGTPLTDETIRRWFDERGLRSHKIREVIAGGSSPDRDTRFPRIGELIGQYEAAGNPYFSIDTKAKEHPGELFRAGRIRGERPFKAYDHDFPGRADGVIVRHGIHDPRRNRGHLNVGLSHDTSEFACDSLRRYWRKIGRQCSPFAGSILLLRDRGGSNPANKYIFKHDPQTLAEEIGIEIRVAHYPGYCSKYNPIERRLFPHVSRACTGMLFDTPETVVALMRRAATSTGLRTTANVIRRAYETGRNATEEIKRTLRIVSDDLPPKWNYRASPQNPTVVS